MSAFQCYPPDCRTKPNMSSKPGPSPKKRKTENECFILPGERYEERNQRYHRSPKKDANIDIESIDHHTHTEEIIDHSEQHIRETAEESEDRQLSEALGFPVNKKVSRGRKRLPLPENANGTRQRYYDRYKNQDYVKRNDIYKYCQICKRKVQSKLRSLPSEHRLRRCWILRLNLDLERSAELWLRDAFSDATHCGEVCQLHFPVGTENCKNRDLFPNDMRQDSHNFNLHDDEHFDFEALELECVYCDNKAPLRNMIPFVRTRSRRYKWINALADNDETITNMLQDRLKNGASKFLCDWHISDDDFDINQYGEWRLRKDALPNPQLRETDKKAQRVYMINHGDTILARSIDGRRREEVLFAKDYRFLAQKARQSSYSNYYTYENQYAYDEGTSLEAAEIDDDSLDVDSANFIEEPPLVEREEIAGSSSNLTEDQLDVSDDSEVENEVDEEGYRFCVVCDRAISNETQIAAYRPRIWPFDEPKHLKWLEFLNWGPEFDAQMKELWRRRRASMANPQLHPYQPLVICQNHVDHRRLQEKYDYWLQTYCVLCDQDLGDANLLLPFPRDRRERLLWMHALLRVPTIVKTQEKRWKWLKERLTRPKPTRYRLCVYHFASNSFDEKDECVEFNDASLPLPLGLPEYDLTPRGIYGVIKCPLCEEWSEQSELIDIRVPVSQAERILLVEMLNGDKSQLKRGVEQLSLQPCRICRNHIPPDIVDPYTIIAERKLVAQIEIQCIQCNQKDIGANMVPLPFNPEQRRHWVDALARDHATRTRLLQRLSIDGRHYLCTAHFHKSCIRFIPNLGVWKRFGFLPLAATAVEREKYLTQADPGYNPLIVHEVDDRGEGIIQELNYDEVLTVLEEVPSEAAFEGPSFIKPEVVSKSSVYDINVKTENMDSVNGESLLDQTPDEPPLLEPEVGHRHVERRNDARQQYEEITEEELQNQAHEIVEEVIEEDVSVDEHHLEHQNIEVEHDAFHLNEEEVAIDDTVFVETTVHDVQLHGQEEEFYQR